jgi:flavorubredoxin
MAYAVAEGVKNVGKIEVEIKYFTTPEELEKVDGIVIGMPTYHHDMTKDMKKILEEIAVKETKLKGKVGGTFGSYGWSGEAPRLVLEVMEKKFEMNVIKPPLLIKYAPDEKGLEDCRKLGKRIAEEILKTI